MFYFKHPKRKRVGNLDYRLDPRTTGKWVVMGNRAYVGGLWKQTREMVKNGKLVELKFTRTRSNFVNKRYALLVYADRNSKNNFYDILKNLDSSLNPRWISNDMTRRRGKIKNLASRLKFLNPFS
jgi:hypothetical protein